jgi:hypothetical protein
VVVVEGGTGAGAGTVVVVVDAGMVVVDVGAVAVVDVAGAFVVVVVGFGTIVVVVAAPAPTAPTTASDDPPAMTAAAANTARLVHMNLKTIDILSASALPPSRRLYRPMAPNREPRRTNFVQFLAGHASGATRPEIRLSVSR